jgi:hypothetical protein
MIIHIFIFFENLKGVIEEVIRLSVFEHQYGAVNGSDLTGQQIGLRGLAAISPGFIFGMNFCQSPETIVGEFITRTPSLK